MESGGSLHVKAVLLKEGREEGAKEIRRFQMEDERRGSGGGADLEGLLARVHSLFGVDPSSQHCTLYWKDADGDLVRCSRDDELGHALDCMTDGTLRVYLTVSSNSNISGEGPSAPPVHEDSNHRAGARFFHGPPPPPPPPPPFDGHHRHPFGPPPPPFPGPWSHGGWKHAGPGGCGRGGWKGGWRGGLYFGCPWNMPQDLYGKAGRKGKGPFKHCFQKKMMKKAMKNMAKQHGQHHDKAFQELRQQVPAEFRQWVHLYIQTWFSQGPEAAEQTAASRPLPKDVGQQFPQWLHSFMARHYPHHGCTQGGETAMNTEGGEGETDEAPDCIPGAYYQWLSRFCRMMSGANDNHCGAFPGYSEEGQQQFPGATSWGMFGPGFFPQKRCRRFGKHAWCKAKMKGHNKHRSSSSSESSDSEGGKGAAHSKVPKAFRKFVRMTFKTLRKGGKQQDKKLRKVKEKATRGGVGAEVQQFAEQVMGEWSARLTRCPQPRSLAVTMEQEERTLPAGLQRHHFLWLLRFLARCHQVGPRGCDVTSGWLNDSSSSSSEEEDEGVEAKEEGGKSHDCGPCPPGPPPMMGMPPLPPHFMGMHPPPPTFPGMHPGMGYPMAPPPYPFGFYPMRHPHGSMGDPHDLPFPAPDHEGRDSDTSPASDDVECVTEGVKKM